jgi:predicted DNA-binding protein with PD1-like motif
MKSKLLADDQGQRTFVVVFDPGEDAVEGMLQFARQEEVAAASLTAIGGFERVDLGFYDTDAREYRHIPVSSQSEVLALTGNIARTEKDEPRLHAHVVIGLADGSTRGGHLFANRVRPTLEVVVTEEPGFLQRREDPSTGLALLEA